jgi:hypothetical protein
MEDNLNEEQLPNFDQSNDSSYGGDTTYTHLGRVAAQARKSNALLIEPALEEVYHRFISDEEMTEEGRRNRIQRLRGEITQKKNLKIQSQSDLNTQQQFRDDKENVIEELEIDRIKVKDGEAPAFDYIPFVIGLFITILLTFYLFVFYSSSGYSAFYGIKQGTTGFINPNVFSEAKTKGGGVIALIVLFPVIFLGLGFLIHDALEKKKYGFITLLLLFTLITDSFIGYKISENIHSNAFNANETSEQWRFSMIYTDINFYLVLALGFVVYVIWGFLLHYVLNKNKEMQPDKAIELRLENLTRKITERREELAIIIAKINDLNAQIATLENEISGKEEDVNGYENGVNPVDIPRLKSSIGRFMGGWFAYTGMMFPRDANRRNQEAQEKQINWLTRKLESLETDK